MADIKFVDELLLKPISFVSLTDISLHTSGMEKKGVVCVDSRQGFSGSRIRTACVESDIGLCIGACFEMFHTLVNYKL